MAELTYLIPFELYFRCNQNNITLGMKNSQKLTKKIHELTKPLSCDEKTNQTRGLLRHTRPHRPPSLALLRHCDLELLRHSLQHHHHVSRQWTMQASSHVT